MTNPSRSREHWCAGDASYRRKQSGSRKDGSAAGRKSANSSLTTRGTSAGGFHSHPSSFAILSPFRPKVHQFSLKFQVGTVFCRERTSFMVKSCIRTMVIAIPPPFDSTDALWVLLRCKQQDPADRSCCGYIILLVVKSNPEGGGSIWGDECFKFLVGAFLPGWIAKTRASSAFCHNNFPNLCHFFPGK